MEWKDAGKWLVLLIIAGIISEIAVEYAFRQVQMPLHEKQYGDQVLAV
jgi:hypothetical protein